MGLDIAGNVTSISPAGAALFLSPSCCNPTGEIFGRKINDADHDGSIDVSENGTTTQMGGWVITATNTQTGTTYTTVTDANGYYYFMNLPPGTYTVTEQMWSNWTQSPGNTGTYTVVLAVGQAIQQDFLNYKQEHPTDCATVTPVSINCVSDVPGQYLFIFNLTNHSGMPAYYMLLTPTSGSSSGFNITPTSPIAFNPVLADGATTTCSIYLNGAHQGTVLL